MTSLVACYHRKKKKKPLTGISRQPGSSLPLPLPLPLLPIGTAAGAEGPQRGGPSGPLLSSPLQKMCAPLSGHCL